MGNIENIVRIQFQEDSIYLRFERIKPPYDFDLLRQSLYQTVKSAKWNNALGWMVIPLDDLGRVMEFCYTRFPSERVVFPAKQAWQQLKLRI